MRNKKILNFFAQGRKWVFTLALFILVFAAASVVKVEAASTIIGWLWGGSEDSNLGAVGGCDPASPTFAPAGCINGNETGVGWISMNNNNDEIPDAQRQTDRPYNVTIDETGKFSGYAWANASNAPGSTASDAENGLGWIDFNPQDHCVTDANGILDDLASSGEYEADSCNVPAGSGCVKGVSRSDNNLTGCARIVSIAQASVTGNNGGWDGWLRMEDVTIDPVTNKISGYAWSGEKDYDPIDNFVDEGLGWISFGRATIEDVCGLTIAPLSFSLANSATIKVTAETGLDLTANKVISFTKSGTNPDKFILEDSSCLTGADGSCSVNVTPFDRDSAWTATITAKNDDCGEKSTDGTVIPVPTCVVTCDSSVSVLPEQSKYYNVRAIGSGCDADRACSITSGSSKIISNWDDGVGKCKVTALPGAKYDTAVSTSTAGTGPESSCDTDVNVTAPGWIETNP